MTQVQIGGLVVAAYLLIGLGAAAGICWAMERAERAWKRWRA